MKAFLSTVVAGLLVTATPGLAANIRYNNFEPPGAVTNVEMADFFKDLSAATKGSLTGQIFPGGQLLGPTATLKGIGDRVVDGGFIVTALAIGALPTTNVTIDLMFQVKDQMVSLAAAFDTWLTDCPTCAEEAKKANVVWLGGFAPTPWHLMCRSPVNSFDDLRGRKIRVTGASATRLVAAFNAVPVQLPPTEIGAALQGGQIDCAVGPLPWLKEYGLMSTVKSVVDEPLGVAHALGMYVFNRDVYNGLTADEKQAIAKVIPVASVRGSQRYKESADNARKESEKQGVTFWKADQKFQDAMKKFVADEVPLVTADLKKRGVVDPDTLIKAHLANIDKWTKRVAGMGGDMKKLSDAISAEIFSKAAK